MFGILRNFIYHKYHEMTFWLWNASGKILAAATDINYEIENPSMQNTMHNSMTSA